MTSEKLERRIFVVMPFGTANGRTHEDLTYFFDNHIKNPIEENSNFAFSYRVKRSESEFSMTDGIISDLVGSDIVICDVSGPKSNANVMYELGIRLSVSTKPVILIRETVPENENIFDIHGLYQHPYTQARIAKLEEFLVAKIKSLESDPQSFQSPILKAINANSTYWSTIPKDKACAFLGGLALATEMALRIFGSQVQTHIIERDRTIVPYPPSEVYQILQRVTDPSVLKDFSYSFARLPALDNYLSSIYLMGLVSPEIEQKFREFLIAYSANFLATTSPFIQADKTLLFAAYAAESLILVNICRSLINMLRAKAVSIEESRAILAFNTNVDKSNMWKNLNG